MAIKNDANNKKFKKNYNKVLNLKRNQSHAYLCEQCSIKLQNKVCLRNANHVDHLTMINNADYLHLKSLHMAFNTYWICEECRNSIRLQYQLENRKRKYVLKENTKLVKNKIRFITHHKHQNANDQIKNGNF
ncbi:hypothetical protein M0812_20354 [Anaeramoeba flamelloides]|uniref:Uncharacterized protein n=1 Tax=Anaeramoeba flamelloides TaxID=1746091 RepID=A0AAV7YZQ3_9EUKA|nr:hypothetical protein M0812_20354 [Anaeramoeba flamelloides]